MFFLSRTTLLVAGKQSVRSVSGERSLARRCSWLRDAEKIGRVQCIVQGSARSVSPCIPRSDMRSLVVTTKPIHTEGCQADYIVAEGKFGGEPPEVLEGYSQFQINK